MAPPQKKLKITADPQELWELNLCVACKIRLNATSKILECLHGMCQRCFILNSKVPGHCVCKCGKETGLSTGFINCSISCEKFDESTLRNNYRNQEYQKKDDKPYRTKAPCPNCVDKYIELYCITCKTFHCALCQLMDHRSHEFKNIDAVMEEIRSNLCKNKVDLCEKSNFVSNAKLHILEEITKINMHKVGIKKKIHKQFEEIRAELLRSEKKMQNDVELYYKENIENSTNTCLELDRLKKKCNFYLNFAESVLNKQKNADLDITHFVNKQLENLRKDFTDDISKLDSTNPNINLKVKLGNTLHQLNKSVTKIIIHDPRKYEEGINEIIKTMSITSCPGYLEATIRGKTTQSTLVDDKEVKKITDYNCARQEKKSLTFLHADTNNTIQEIQQLHNHYLRNQPGNYGDELGIWLKSFFGLPFLPVEKVKEGFLELMSTCPNENGYIFSDYILKSYIESGCLFPPELWASEPSISPRDTEKNCIVRTTNGAESFHKMYNEQFHSAHPPTHVVISALMEIQAETMTKINSILLETRTVKWDHPI